MVVVAANRRRGAAFRAGVDFRRVELTAPRFALLMLVRRAAGRRDLLLEVGVV